MNTENSEYFELKAGGDFIRIDLLRLSYPDAGNDWDENWINTEINMKAGAFSGHFSTSLMTVEFKRFKHELSELYKKLKGTAKFKTLEDQISIEIIGNGLGHMSADCILMDDAGIGNKLYFKIEFDQTFIPDMIRQLDHITRVYPSTGDLK